MNQQGRDLKGPRFADILSTAWTQHGLKRVTTAILQFPKEENRWTTIVHATVVTERGEFSAIGDANPENAGRMIAPHAIRFAESRAIARALRWATNAGEAVDVEMGDYEPPPAKKEAGPTPAAKTTVAATSPEVVPGEAGSDLQANHSTAPPQRKGAYSAAELRAFRDAALPPANLKSAADRFVATVQGAGFKDFKMPAGMTDAETLGWLIKAVDRWEKSKDNPTSTAGAAF